MKITTDNIKLVPEKERKLLLALLLDLPDLNFIKDSNIYIDWQDFHNEYSPERTDPCPDYYGYYTLRDEKNPSKILGVEMNIDELDSSLCLLYDYASII